MQRKQQLQWKVDFECAGAEEAVQERADEYLSNSGPNRKDTLKKKTKINSLFITKSVNFKTASKCQFYCCIRFEWPVSSFLLFLFLSILFLVLSS